jgi:hypothetical protein
MSARSSLPVLGACALLAGAIALSLMVPAAAVISVALVAAAITLVLRRGSRTGRTAGVDQARRPGSKGPQARRAATGRRIPRRAFLVAGLTAAGVAVVALRDRQAGPVAGPRSPGQSTPSPSPRATSTPPASRAGLWLSPDEIAALPDGGDSFDTLRASADRPIATDDISNQDSGGPSHAMAVALVAARLDDDRLRGRVRDAIAAIIGTEDGSTGGHPDRNRPLGLGRNLPGYIIAADLIDLARFDRAADGRFRSWIDELRSKRLRGSENSLVEVEPLDHSNWGAYRSAGLTAANLYLGDRAATARSAQILRGWLGDPAGIHEWQYDTERHDYSWQCHYPDVDRYVPVNPAGCSREGFDLSGIISIDMQRGEGFRVPPRFTRYPRESLHGRVIQGELLFRAGYPVWDWADRAFWRIAERQVFLARSFDSDWYEPRIGCYWILAYRYDAPLELEAPTTGRSVSGVDWTHSTGR